MERIYIKPTDRVFVLTGARDERREWHPDLSGHERVVAELPCRRGGLSRCMAARSAARVGLLFHAQDGRSECPAQPGASSAGSLERTLGSRLFLCTQNVDNLHEQAGSRPLLMHGELFKSRCERCQLPFDDTNVYHEVPLCACGGKIRPHICWFGERPFGMDRVFRTLEVCTVFSGISCVGVP